MTDVQKFAQRIFAAGNTYKSMGMHTEAQGIFSALHTALDEEGIARDKSRAEFLGAAIKEENV